MQTRWMKTGQSVTLALTLLLSIGWITMGGMGSARAQDDGNLDVRGLVQEMPSEGVTGTWQIADVSMVADAETEIDESDGELKEGACADAEYVKDGEINKAVRIQSKMAVECSATITETPSPESTETETPEATETMTVTVTVTVTATATATTTATQTVEPTKTPTPKPTMDLLCEKDDEDDDGEDGDNATPVGRSDGGGDGESHDGDKCKVFGRITGFPPSGFVGLWTVNTISYTVNNETELRTKHGMFVEGACVKVEFKQVAGERIARKIETDRAFRCDGDDHDNGRHGGEMFGIVESFPISLTGEWKVGNMTFVATTTTEFKQEKGPFEISGTVKIKFWTDVNEVNYALKIETKFKKPAHHDDDDDGDDDHDGDHHGAEGMAVGKIEAISATVATTRTTPTTGTVPTTGTIPTTGTWTIGGIDYLVNPDTKLEEKKGELKIGVLVRVRYHLNSDGKRVADKIKMLAKPGTPEAGEDAHLAGFIEMMPSEGFSGTWKIAGVSFEISSTTRFEEKRGVLAVGAYVIVEYIVEEGVNIIVEIKTMVPPGGGDKDDLGTIEQDEDSATVNSAGVSATTIWVIGGKSYTVTDATVLDDDAGNLAVGSKALVNSYTDASGVQVATRIEAVVLSNFVFLPSVRR